MHASMPACAQMRHPRSANKHPPSQHGHQGQSTSWLAASSAAGALGFDDTACGFLLVAPAHGEARRPHAPAMRQPKRSLPCMPCISAHQKLLIPRKRPRYF